ncbi:MAG: nuclear transport factor 2 family protein [Myxococcota bacterium]
MPSALHHAKMLYLEGIRDGNPREAVNAHTGNRYTQHSTGVRDGRDGFIAFFDDFIKRNPERSIDIVRGWQDGRHVFLHAYQELGEGGPRYVTTDFFDSDDEGKIVEHWDVIREFKGQTPSGHTDVDGATEITDLDKTEQNKQLVRDLIESCMFHGTRAERIEEFISAETYIQHNHGVADGLENFKALAQAENRPLNYDEIVLLVGSGNFVATLCKADWEGDKFAQVDIFRIENGKVVEHWDNVEPVPDNPVNGGKF